MTSDHGLEYHVVDVFTDRPFAGNPLAVVLGAESLSTDQLQQIANEFHLSETAFPIFAGDLQGADYRLRIFTPEVELPFAGHPSVGTGWLLASLGRIGYGTSHQLCGAGRLAVDVTEDGATIAGGESQVTEAVDPDAAVAAIGLTQDDLSGHPVKVASAGLPYVIVPATREAIDRCTPDLTALRKPFGVPGEMTGVYVVAWDDNPTQVHARMFAGDIGAVEDPATGSAALALAVYLVNVGLMVDGRTTLEVTQGVELGRPSLLRVDVELVDGQVVRTRVSGQVVEVATGTIAVPADAT
jgi:trans-2,3-dihydro-3-hydroxyanthranilate isomerase